MIITELYNGQGLGNQLWCYVTTRCIAKNHGYQFGIQSPDKFKGANFLHLDFGEHVIGGHGPEGGPPTQLPAGIVHYYQEQAAYHPLSKADIRLHDPLLMGIPDNTKIDGNMQDEHYIAAYKEDIRQWLTIDPSYDCRDFSHDNICIVNFRGGEYARHSDVFLPKRYWDDAMKNMQKINPQFKFVVITDDPTTAKRFFPDLEVYHFSIGKDYAIIHRAHYLILSNSSFAWFPAWLSKDLRYCIAPKYWARHAVSDGYWSLGYNITSGWWYQDREGVLFDHDTCVREFDAYKENHIDYFKPVHPPTYAFTPSSRFAQLLHSRFAKKAKAGIKRLQQMFSKKQ
jgi:hypothetical protein